MDLVFEGSLEDLCQKLETELGRDFLVDITPKLVEFDVRRVDAREFDYRRLKIILVRSRGMFTNAMFASVALLDGRVIYDEGGPVYNEQMEVACAIKKMCK